MMEIRGNVISNLQRAESGQWQVIYKSLIDGKEVDYSRISYGQEATVLELKNLINSYARRNKDVVRAVVEWW